MLVQDIHSLRVLIFDFDEIYDVVFSAHYEMILDLTVFPVNFCLILDNLGADGLNTSQLHSCLSEVAIEF